MPEPEQKPESEQLDPDRQNASAYQHSWMDVADIARQGFAKKCSQIHELQSGDIQALSVAAINFFWLEHNVRQTDKLLADARAKQAWED